MPLSGLRGKVVLLTFLDPVCVTDCPLIAQEFRQAGQLLGGDARRVELVAVDVNPLYNELAYTQAFDRQEGLAGVPDWLYLTGSPGRLRQVYRAYGVASETSPGGAMLAHNDVAFVIDQAGHLRQELNFDPGAGHRGYQVLVRRRAGGRGHPAGARLMNASRCAAAALALAVLAAGCGSAARPANTPGSPAVPLSLTTAVTGPGATWAAVPMGAASGADQFWQLFMLPAGGGQWSLQTPPDIATNGALVLAGQRRAMASSSGSAPACTSPSPRSPRPATAAAPGPRFRPSPAWPTSRTRSPPHPAAA